MSFSTDVKKELSKINNLANKTCVRLEFLGYLSSVNVSNVDNSLRFSTESEYNINRFSKLLKNLNIEKYNIDMQGKNYVITMQNKNIAEIITDVKTENDEEDRAYVRGCFLGSGSINNPENKYHIEFIVKDRNIADEILQILNKYNIHFKKLEKENAVSLYSKDGEEISKFLAFIGANSSVLRFEDIRVYRDMRNNVNRIVNCETANLSKTVNAAVKQIDAINKLKESGKYNNLSENLKEIAKLRIKYPEVSLVELGKMLNPPIGKSGVNHRMKAILKLVEEL